MEWNISLWKLHVVMGLSMSYKHGEEANELYKESYRCIMCGSAPREPKKSAIVEQFIDGKSYVFDSNGCAIIYRRLRNVMGEETVAMLA